MNNLRRLIKIRRSLYHYSYPGIHGEGANENMTGDCSGLYGNCTGLAGDCSGLTGNCGDVYGDCSNVNGDCTNIMGDFDNCKVTKLTDIKELVR